MAMDRFEDIIGQDEAVRHLQTALKEHRISHSYIIHGDRGSSKKELAMAFAAALLCEQPENGNGIVEPCGKCRSCLQVLAGDHPDIRVFTHRKKTPSEKSVALNVDEVRALRNDVQIKPYSSDYKIYIVEHAESMNASAQNALLKTLEEPPEYAVIFLLSENLSTFLPTVLSRCVTLQLHPVAEKLIAAYLEKKELASKERAALLAGLSHGNLQRAAELSRDEDFAAFLGEALALLRTLQGRNAAEIIAFTQKIADKKLEISRADDFLDITESYYRDILLQKAGMRQESLIFKGEIPYIAETAEQLSMQQIQQILEAAETARRRRSNAGNDALILEMMLLDIRSVLKSR